MSNKIFYIEDENNIPAELLAAKAVELNSAIGWFELDEPEFRCGLEYRVKEQSND